MGNRTPDLFHAMEALYQLSYSPIRAGQISRGVHAPKPGGGGVPSGFWVRILNL